MVAIIAIAALVVFLAGGVLGAILLVVIAIHKEERRRWLSLEAPDRISAAGRFVTGLEIRRPARLERRHEKEMAGLRRPWR